MSSGGGAGAAADGGFGLLTEMLGFKPALRSSGKAVASFSPGSVVTGLVSIGHSLTGPLALVFTVVGLVLSLSMASQHGGCLLFFWLVQSCGVQFPAEPWLRWSHLKLWSSRELGSSPNRLSADRMVNCRLLLLLLFSSASFLPLTVLALLLSLSGMSGTFTLSEIFEAPAGLLLPVEASALVGEL